MPTASKFKDYAFTVTVEVESPLDRSEPADFITTFCAKIFHSDEDDNQEEAGRLYMHKIALNSAEAAGFSKYDTLEGHTSDLWSLCEPLIDEETDDWQPFLSDEFYTDCIFSLLAVHVCAINPKYRGNHLGLKLTQRAIELIGEDCEFAVCQPMQVTSNEIMFGELPEEWLLKSSLNTKQLCQYWAKLGFKRIGKTKIFGMVPGL